MKDIICRVCGITLTEKTSAGTNSNGHMLRTCKICSRESCYTSRWKKATTDSILGKIAKLDRHIVLLRKILNKRW